MPLVETIEDAQLVFIDTEIGRGHPGYLDGTLAAVAAKAPDLPVFRTDVFAVSRGIAQAGWRGVQWLYRAGGRGGAITTIYNYLRQSSSVKKGGGPAPAVLGRDLRRLVSRTEALVVVSHPILAQLLAPVAPVIYQHGELAAPTEAMVRGCRQILVPWPETAARFEKAGLPAESLVITGQCIEPPLVGLAESSLQVRIGRLNGRSTLTAAFFTSGAYPPTHIRRLLLAVRSFTAAGHKAVVFCGHSESVAGRMISWLRRQGLTPEEGTGGSAEVRIVVSLTREEENRTTAALFPELDLCIAPAHERTNWAVGLGLPFFILCPHIGSYAPLNAAIASDRQVAVELSDDRAAAGAGGLVGDLRRTGRLATMAANGFGRTALDGFDISARLLVRMVSDRAAVGLKRRGDSG
jgi:hypothetical protein